MNFDFATVITTALVSGGIQFGIWVVITRNINRRDVEIDALTKEVKTLRDDKLVVLGKQIEDSRESRKFMHRQIEAMDKSIVRHDEQLERVTNDMQTLRDTELKLATTAALVDSAMDRVEALTVQQNMISEKLAATAALVADRRKGS